MRERMPLYVVLGKFTDKRMENIKDLQSKVQEVAKRALDSVGARMVIDLFTMGQYDTVTIVDAPNDEAMARALLDFGRLGVTRTETLKAFTVEEYSKIIGELP